MSASHQASTPPPAKLRLDIQGLRAVAVLTVVAGHAGLGLSGGYVGVDVFFVISGFLISQLLFREAEREGSISLRRFYARRARRILPAATLVTLATVLGSVLWISKVQAYQVAHDAWWATIFLANVHFADREVDYFAQDEPASPLLHYWSLSVEEQFYLVWPLLLLALLLWRLRPRVRDDGLGGIGVRLPRGSVAALLVVVAGSSLVYSVVRTAATPQSTYFSGVARAWELALGALAALAAPYLAKALVPLVRTLLTGGGLVAIGWACVTYDELTMMPGYAALLPVLGSAAVLLGGAEGVGPDSVGSVSLPGRLLSLPPLRAIGDWSYSLYLWHWPLLWLPRLHDSHRLGLAPRLLLVLAAVALAAATYRWVETPFRTDRRLTTGRSLALYPAVVAAVATASLSASAWIQWSVGEYGDNPAVTLTDFGVPDESGYQLPADPRLALVQASVIAAEHHMAVPSDLTPDVLTVGDDIPDVGECEYWTDTRALCRRGAEDGTRTLVVLGDSHGRMWIPALEQIARRAGYATYYLVKPQCTPARVVVGEQGTTRPWQQCADFNAWALDRLRELQPDLLLVSTSAPTRRSGVFVDGRQTFDTREIATALSAGFDRLFAEITPLAGRTVLIADVPAGPVNPIECLTSGEVDLGSCMFEPNWRALHLGRQAVESAERAGVQVVDPRPWVCWNDHCPVVVGSTITYRDLDHLTATYAGRLARPLGQQLGLWGR